MLETVDDKVAGVIIRKDGEYGWYMRLSAPTMLEEAMTDGDPDDNRDFIWYAMQEWGWYAVRDPAVWKPLEAQWQEQKERTIQ